MAVTMAATKAAMKAVLKVGWLAAAMERLLAGQWVVLLADQTAH